MVNQPNSGKSSALNNAINHADPRATVIMTMDADTLFRTTTVRMLARHFIQTPHTFSPGGRGGRACEGGQPAQHPDRLAEPGVPQGICVIRMAEMMVNAIGIVPGACSAWRRRALEQIGGFCEDTLAEDADAAMTFQRLGYAVLHENAAICDTEAPETLSPLLKQRSVDVRQLPGDVEDTGRCCSGPGTGCSACSRCPMRWRSCC